MKGAARCLVLALAAWTPVAAAAKPCLELLYFERPPFYVTVGPDRVDGLVARRAARALDAAGACYRWRRLPANRHLAEVRRNARPLCAVGWFRTQDRERYAKFSAPLYRDRPMVALGAPGRGIAGHYGRVDELLGRTDLILGLRSGFSYGPYLDERIARIDPRRHESARSVTRMAGMLLRGRIDYLFVSGEEADYLALQSEGDSVVVAHFDDLPMGNARHLFCTRRTDDALLEAVDRAIAAGARR